MVRAAIWSRFARSAIRYYRRHHLFHGYCHMLHLGLPVRIGGLMVTQGDLLHGDANGVTNIPPEIACEVADVAGDFVRAEAIMLDYVKSSGTKSRRNSLSVAKSSSPSSRGSPASAAQKRPASERWKQPLSA